VSTVELAVRAARTRMRRTAILGAAVRWSLYGALLAGGWLAASRLFEWPRSAIWIAAALPVLAAAAAAVRRLDLRDAAASIDRALGLEERVATAIECSGPLAPAVSNDAARALERVRPDKVGSFRWPGEARFLIPALVFVGLLAAAPDPGPARPEADPDFRSAIETELNRLERARADDPALAAKVRQILENLRSNDLRRVADGAVAARRLAVEIRTELAKSGGRGDREALRALAERLEAAGSGASSELARRDVVLPEVAPEDIEARAAAARARGDLGEGGRRPTEIPVPKSVAGAPIAPEVRGEIQRSLAEKNYDRRYDEVVRGYYERLR
jgi:hypothetical protein